MTRFHRTPAFLSLLLAAACGGAAESRDTATAGGAVASSQPAADPTGKVIKIQMVSDEKGKGRIEIAYASYDELDRLIAKLI